MSARESLGRERALVVCAGNVYAYAHCRNMRSRVYCTLMTLLVTPIQLTLKELRERAGLTQTQLANRVGVRQATISDLETGKSARIDFALLDRLCDVLGTTPNELLEREPKRRRRS